MPNITNYDSVRGKILATKTGSLASVNLLDDALGCVTATSLSTSVTANDTYRYLPYGGTLSRSGTKADPMVGWVGSWGYRNNYRNGASHYVRARNYDKWAGRWITADPLPLAMVQELGFASQRLLINKFHYVNGRPLVWVDPTGLEGVGGMDTTPGFTLPGCLDIPVPATRIGPISINVKIQACIQCFDTKCCRPPGMYASSCLTYSMGFSASLGIPNPLGLIGDIKIFVQWITNLLGGGFNVALSCANPERACVEKGFHTELSACVSVCLSFYSLKYCAGSGFKEEGGWCGFPSLSVSVLGKFVDCK